MTSHAPLQPPTAVIQLRNHIRRWFDASAAASARSSLSWRDDPIDWARVVPFVLMHIACLAVIVVGWSPVALVAAAVTYTIRMFSITGFYHRYFSHRSFKTSRAAQFLFAALGASAVQRGPIWWAAHHRHHHAHSDQHDDPHSPMQHGFIRAHMGWFLTRKGFEPDLRRVRDLSRYPELRWLDRFDILVPVLMAVVVFATGWTLESKAPALGTSRWQLLVWAFFVSTIVCYHCTYTINSLSHAFGRKRYVTDDESRNNWMLALITFGEGWHNNHHYYPASARQGFYWWEIDLTFYALRALAALHIIWDLKAIPIEVRDARPMSRKDRP